MHLSKIHHIAIIVSDYEAAKNFYVNKLGFSVIREVSAKYCYVTHELRLHQNDRCKRFTLF